MRTPSKYKPRSRKGPIPFRYILLLSFKIIERGIKPTLMSIAATDSNNMVTSMKFNTQIYN
ncbi:hypothetical protein [Alkalihalobacillus deserti]|uniref:hypothetical protein n=1 Tax=Alkalihalobacillus deserti TaxID=2879466 RepID=UPI001D15D75C|nr:hypothetical protein [Alkalihalobacillus deserti]